MVNSQQSDGQSRIKTGSLEIEMISHYSGIELLKRREACIGDECQILPFLISNSHDPQLLEMYKSFAREIDASIGPACVAFAYMSVPETCPDWPDLQERPQTSEMKWSAYHKEMTEAALEIKRLFGLQEFSQPSLLLLEPALRDEISFIHLRDYRFAKEFLNILKRKILKWYEKNWQAIRKNDLKMLSVMNRKPGRIQGREKALQERSLREQVVPRLSKLLEKDIDQLDEFAQHRLRRILAKLENKPRELIMLKRFMEVYSYSASSNTTSSITQAANDDADITELEITASTLTTVYDKLVEEFIQKPSEAAHREFGQVPFPTDCFRDFGEFDSFIEFTSPTRMLQKQFQNTANNLDWWEVIRAMVPEGFEI